MSTSKQGINDGRIVLGSRSPQRYELLCYLVGESRVSVCPPLNSDEADISDVRHVDQISRQLLQIARAKHADVFAQLKNLVDPINPAAIITADTVIVGFDAEGLAHVLGQPPENESWSDIVRQWFEQYLLRAPHQAITALCVSCPMGESVEQVVTTEVTFRSDGGRWLDWYLATEESRGKAGGYGLQGAASLFVQRIDGSSSNVIGLPLSETGEALRKLGALNDCV